MKAIELVFVPAPAVGHIVSTVEFAKSLLARDQGLSVTILIIKLPFHSSANCFANELAASNASIRFIDLPPTDPPQPKNIDSPEKQFSLFIESHKSHVRDAIIERVLPNSSNSFGGIVLDWFCSSMIDVAKELGVPAYVFFTSGAAFLSLFCFLPLHYSQKGGEFNHSDADSIIPGFSNPVPTSVLPSVFFSKGGYESLLDHAGKLNQTKGIFINTFSELEIHLIQSLRSIHEMPKMYTIGPLLSQDGQKKSDSNRESILQWLGDQSPSSVVFLCFGSFGSFAKAQLAQIATALEQSGHRFLWSIRQQVSSQTYVEPGEYADLSDAVPEGFLERTQNRGMVCGWAPQGDILAHESIGCFVSHCGWNSILESVWHGVPIVTWPLYAEQQFNAFELVKELGLAVELTLDYRSENGDQNLVMAKEIENAINSVMDMENPSRKRVKEMKEMSRKALEEGGSSFISTGSLIQDVRTNMA